MPSGPDSLFVNKPFTRQQWMVVLIATAVAAGLRLYQLGEWSVWVDEAHTWRDATMPLTGERGFMEEQRRYYPLPFLLLRLLLGVGVIGYDEWSVRVPFAVVGVLTVPLLALCGRRLVGTWPAVLAACLLAINPWHIFWSQNARGYGMAMLGAVLAMHRLYMLFARGRGLDLLLAAGYLAFTAMSHPPAVSLGLGFAAFLVVRHALRPHARLGVAKIALMLVVLAVVLPWLVRHYELFSNFQDAKGNPSFLHWMETVAYYFRPSVLLLGLLAMFLAPRVLSRDRAIYVTCLVLVPMLAISAIGAQLVKVTARYAICTLPALMLLGGFVITEVGRRLRALPDLTRGRAWLLASVLPALVVGDFLRLDVAYFQDHHGQRGRWREAAEFVRGAAEKRGFAGMRVLTVNHPTMLYYLRPRHWFVGEDDPYPHIDIEAVVHWRFENGTGSNDNVLHEPGAENHLAWHLEHATEGEQLFAVVLTLPELREQDKNGSLEAALRRDFELARYLPTWIGPKDASIYIFLPKKTE